MSVSSVVNVFDETTNSVSAGSRSRSTSTRDRRRRRWTRSGTRSVAVAVRAQRVVRHRGAEVAAADADVHDRADRAGPCAPSTRPTAPDRRTRPSRSSTPCTCSDDVDTVDHERRAAWHPQRDVQGRSILGDVDVVARGTSRRCARAGHARRRARTSSSHRLGRDAVLGVVERTNRPPRRAAGLRASRIGGEQRRRSCPGTSSSQFGRVRRERAPLGEVVERGHRGGRASEQAGLPFVPRQTAPEAVLHEDPRAPVDRRRAVRGERALVHRRRVAAVRLETVGRIVLGLLGHQRVARHLGDHGRGRDRKDLLVALDDRLHRSRASRR